MSRSRSQNGYGCDDPEEEGEAADIEGRMDEKDPFEVAWDGGVAGNDPMNPRNRSMASKWTVVLLVSACSFCV